MTRESLYVGFRVAARGSLICGSEPQVRYSPDDFILLNWRTDTIHLEVRVRDDGMINWYCTRDGTATGNEGWSRFDPSRPPWRL